MLHVGIDVGGTKCLGVALDADGNVVGEDRRPTPRGTGSVDRLIDTLVELAGSLGDYETLGVGVPGLVTRDGVLRAAPNLDGVADFDVAGGLRAQIDRGVRVDNDATCAALAEWRLGAGRGLERHDPGDARNRHRRWRRRRRRAPARPQRVRRRVRPHGRRSLRSAVRLRSTRMLGAVRVGVRAWRAWRGRPPSVGG